MAAPRGNSFANGPVTPKWLDALTAAAIFADGNGWYEFMEPRLPA